MNSRPVLTVGDHIEVVFCLEPLVTGRMPVIFAGQNEAGEVGYVAAKVLGGVSSGCERVTLTAVTAHEYDVAAWIESTSLDFTAANMDAAIEAQRKLFPLLVTLTVKE